MRWRRWLLATALVIGCDSGSTLPSFACAHGDCLDGADAAAESGDASGGDGGACSQRPCSPASPWSPEHCRCAPVCTLEEQVARHTSVPNVRDCGVLQVDAEAPAREAAERCVLEALDAGQPVKLVAWLMGTDSSVARAYASPGSGELVSILHYDSDIFGGGGGHPRITEQTCRGLTRRADCAAQRSDVCLECVEPVETNTVCSTTRGGEPCRGAGNYEAGKEGSYLPCCEGLTEVAQQRTAEVDGVRMCTDLPLRVYACIEGRCGDGRCERPEAVPCGCTLDCPSAVVTPAP